MNFLAHAYLSFSDPQILAGNMISDFVKGKTKFSYPEKIQQGIMLHRAIDEFTDARPATAAAKLFFRPQYRLYSGAIVDVLYDHYLANDAAQFSEQSLKEFSVEVYESLEQQALHLPQPFLYLLPYMKAQNWLYNYRHAEGIARSLSGLVRRAARGRRQGPRGFPDQGQRGLDEVPHAGRPVVRADHCRDLVRLRGVGAGGGADASLPMLENAVYTIFAEPADRDAPLPPSPPVIAETRVDIPDASVSDAVMMLDLRNTNALMFRNSASGAFNMVYRRGDGTIGWVEPSAK